MEESKSEEMECGISEELYQIYQGFWSSVYSGGGGKSTELVAALLTVAQVIKDGQDG